MEIPHSRRPRSYISSFSVDSAVVASPVHKAESDKGLNSLLPARHQYSRSHSQEATSQRAVSTSPIEFDIQCEGALKKLRDELLEIPFKKKYASVTVPTSIRYSTMASRPRSPKKSSSEPADKLLEQQKMQEELDQSLLRIREQLVSKFSSCRPALCSL